MRFSRRLVRSLAFAALFAAASALPARAALLIDIDKSTQRMSVQLDGNELFNWPVSTGTANYDTPTGEFKPFRMEKDHFSKEWDDAPMPNAIFFTMQGHAIHGTFHKSIGRPASHGCVRLEAKNAATLFGLVKQEKMANTRIVLRGDLPVETAPPVAAKPQPQPRNRTVARGDDGYVSGYDDGGRNAAPRDSYSRSWSNDDAYAAPPPPVQPRTRVTRDGWRVYTDGQRYYYYRDPYAPPPPRRYGYDDGPRYYYYYGR